MTERFEASPERLWYIINDSIYSVPSYDAWRPSRGFERGESMPSLDQPSSCRRFNARSFLETISSRSCASKNNNDNDNCAIRIAPLWDSFVASVRVAQSRPIEPTPLPPPVIRTIRNETPVKLSKDKTQGEGAYYRYTWNIHTGGKLRATVLVFFFFLRNGGHDGGHEEYMVYSVGVIKSAAKASAKRLRPDLLI